MNHPLRTTSAVSLVALASVIAGCASPQGRVASSSYQSGKPDGEVGLATKAMVALNSNNVPQAIDFAERAVAKTPMDAGFRAILGNAYMAAGRFQSAESAYRDSLTIYSNQSQVVLKLALAQIAQGKNARAVATLNEGRDAIDASDYGLALALAGHSQEAIAVLNPAAHEKGADATVRQNLALAYALGGNWTEARTVAAQDVPAGQIDSRIQQWMQLASPKRPSDQVAALLGVTPTASDAGQPIRLALNKADDVQLAAAQPVKKPAPAVPTQVAPTPVAPVVTASTPAFSAPVPVVVAVAPAPPPPRSTMAMLAATAVTEAKAVLAAVTPHRVAPAPKPDVKARPAQQAAVRRGNSPAVVQLGAYGSPARVLSAWDGAARKYGALKAYAPMSARFASPKGTFYRLSVHGFASVGEAVSLCKSLHSQGATCFVRNSAGDAPMQMASR